MHRLYTQQACSCATNELFSTTLCQKHQHKKVTNYHLSTISSNHHHPRISPSRTLPTHLQVRLHLPFLILSVILISTLPCPLWKGRRPSPWHTLRTVWWSTMREGVEGEGDRHLQSAAFKDVFSRLGCVIVLKV